MPLSMTKAAVRAMDTVESVLEELGVPGAEVDLVLVNGESVALSRVLEDGDDLAVYPPFARVDVAPLRREARRDVAAGLAVLGRPRLTPRTGRPSGSGPRRPRPLREGPSDLPAS